MKILTLSQYLKSTYGQKVYRLSLSSGCSCPNRDGTLGRGGCTFCSEGGSGDFAAPPDTIDAQILWAKTRIKNKLSKSVAAEEQKYIAYFQSFTNTYARDKQELRRLEQLYRDTLARDEIIVLSLGTRPDCLGDQVMAMLGRLQQTYPEKAIWIELGLQTARDDIAKAFHRGYPRKVFEDACLRLKAHGFSVIVHVILGLPGETLEDMIGTVKYLAQLPCPPDGIKLQLLHVLEGTQLAEAYRAHPFPVMSMEEYTDAVVACLKELPPDCIVHRMTGDGPKKLLIAPKWSSDKKRVLNMLNSKIAQA